MKRAWLSGLALVAIPLASAATPGKPLGRTIDVQVGDADVRVMIRTPTRELGLPAGSDEDALMAATKVLAERLLAETTLELDDVPLRLGQVRDTKLAMGAEPRADVLLAWPLEVPGTIVSIWTPTTSPGPDAVSVFEKRGNERPVLMGAATIRPGERYSALLGNPAPDYTKPQGPRATAVRPQPQPKPASPEAPRTPWVLALGVLAVSAGSFVLWRRERRRTGG